MGWRKLCEKPDAVTNVSIGIREIPHPIRHRNLTSRDSDVHNVILHCIAHGSMSPCQSIGAMSNENSRLSFHIFVQLKLLL